jgi:hypothetical protein
MNESGISLKTVYELRVDAHDEPIRYHIPAYQRGYRWSPTQVTQLLDDIREFTKRNNPQPEEFYCLQPLVLRKTENGAYEVVDGQQRLTTLLLILRYFNERLTEKYRQRVYRLEYETRPDLYGFLDSLSPEDADSNIDFFHIDQAVKTIAEWFEKRESEVEVIKDAFLNRAKVIWFELSPEENAVAAFTRLNVGKIPLTNGELIRALFLKRGKGGPPEPRQLQIAHEWDAMEKSLQSEDFWGFLSNDTEIRGSRIDFIFNLVARQDGMKSSADEYATFNHFSAKLSAEGADLIAEWLEIKKTYMLMEEWFADRHLFHLVGYLVWDRDDLNELLALASGARKQDFKGKLKARIFKRAFGKELSLQLTSEWVADQLDGMEYRPGSARIRRILVLFNLVTLLGNSRSNIRFQFDSFKNAEWDIEHVRSVASADLGTPSAKVGWLDRSLGFLRSVNEATDLQSEIQAFIDLPMKERTDSVFGVVYEKVLRHFKEDSAGEADNGLSNLALLDAATNRSYGNAVFAVKRQRVLSLDRDGIFVPLCTRNVFLKCYSRKVDHLMFWTQEDRDDYRQALIDLLYGFFADGWTYE